MTDPERPSDPNAPSAPSAPAASAPAASAPATSAPATSAPPAAGSGEPDLELTALPPPRHPWRRLTLVTMSATLLLSLALLYSLRSELWFSFDTRAPQPVGELSRLSPEQLSANRWIQGEGELSANDAIAYRRPLETDSYRLARVNGTERLWVQVRVPRDDDDPDHKRFVPPSSFVGRLIPASARGLRFSDLGSAIAEAKGPELPADAWLLIDGEAPATTRWTLGLSLLLLGFAAFNLFGLLRLLRPASA